MMNGSCRCLSVGATHTTPPLPTISIPSSSSSKRAGTSTPCDRHCITFLEDEPSGAHCSSSSSSINRTATTRASAKKYVIEYLCFKCGGDVRLPPLPHSQSSTTSETKTTTVTCEKSDINGIVESGSHSREPSVVCALGCSSPRYHLSCTGIPVGSQIHRSVFGTAADSSLDTVWWSLAPDSVPKKRSYQSLQNDKSWSTSMFSFICPNCDVEGTSRYLAEYFEQFHSMKKSFYSQYLLGGAKQKRSQRLESADESIEARTGDAFLWHLMQMNREEYSRNKLTSETLPLGDMTWNSSEIKLKNMSFVLTYLSKQLQRGHMQQHQRRQKRQKVIFQLDPSYLVGMPIRLFNPIDNSYHTGRILDYKVDAPYKVDEPISGSKQSGPSSKFPVPNISELTDEQISRTLFFVRFRQGIEGRRIAVHQWIYLEEHAVAIGGEICWGKVGNDTYNANERKEICHDHEEKVNMIIQDVASLYRPCQMIFRSLLEMIPVQNLNSSTSCNYLKISHAHLNVLAMGFGISFSHIRLSLDYNADGMDKHLALTIDTGMANTSVPTPDNPTKEQSRPQAIPLAASNPSWINQMLQRVELSDEDVALGLAMAHVEKDEERRVRVRHNLAVSRLIQPAFDEKRTWSKGCETILFD